MGLPDSYRLPSNYVEAYDLMGDGVVVSAVRHLAEHILESVRRRASPGCSLMGKRSDGVFARMPQDAYATPVAGVAPLLPYLDPETRFIEPCAGEGVLVGHLKRAGHVLVSAYDLPDDARTKRYSEACSDVIFVTNPPWARDVLRSPSSSTSPIKRRPGS